MTTELVSFLMPTLVEDEDVDLTTAFLSRIARALFRFMRERIWPVMFNIDLGEV